jgi:hypothetical protein
MVICPRTAPRRGFAIGDRAGAARGGRSTGARPAASRRLCFRMRRGASPSAPRSGCIVATTPARRSVPALCTRRRTEPLAGRRREVEVATALPHRRRQDVARVDTEAVDQVLPDRLLQPPPLGFAGGGSGGYHSDRPRGAGEFVSSMSLSPPTLVQYYSTDLLYFFSLTRCIE